MRFSRLALGALLFFSVHSMSSQVSSTGPILEEYGSVFKISDPDLVLNKKKNYKIMFDIYTDPGGDDKINPLLNTVARFMNMHGQTGLDQEQMDIVVIAHGAGVKNMLNNEAYQEKFGRENPNLGLLEALDKVGVKLYVCGQSLNARGYQPESLASPLKVSLSAMTALVHFQEEGYQLINFN